MYLLMPARRYPHGTGTSGMVVIAIDEVHCQYASTGMMTWESGLGAAIGITAIGKTGLGGIRNKLE